MLKVSEIKYERVDADETASIILLCAKKAENATSAQELIRAREEYLKALGRYETATALSYMRFTLNTADEFYSNENDYYDEHSPVLALKALEFKKAFINSPYLKQAEKKVNPLVAKQYALSLKCGGDKAVPFKIEENKIITEYTKLMSETLFEFNGQKLTLSALKKNFTDSNRSVRKSAYESLGKTLKTISYKLDDIFDRLVKTRTAMAKSLGYDNYLQLGDNMMGRISYNRKMLKKFRNGILKHVVPAVSKLKAELKTELKIQDDFMLYDDASYFYSGNPLPVLSAEEMFEAGKRMYRDMSDEAGEFFDMMVQTEAFDVFPREGKWGGGYCTSFPDYRQPFILANFNGTSEDIDVLTHEAGHAFAEYMVYKQNHDIELDMGGMETAETHSMSMEFFAYKYTNEFFGKRGNDYRVAHLFESFAFLPYGTIVDYFQELVYTNPQLTPAQRNELWLKLEHDFRPWLKTEGIPYLEEGTRWQYQAHIYENPLYYIDYCLAQSVALQFLFESLDDYKKAFNCYTEFLKKGGEEQFDTLIKNAGLLSPFKEETLKIITEKTLKTLEKLKSAN